MLGKPVILLCAFLHPINSQWKFIPVEVLRLVSQQQPTALIKTALIKKGIVDLANAILCIFFI